MIKKRNVTVDDKNMPLLMTQKKCHCNRQQMKFVSEVVICSEYYPHLLHKVVLVYLLHFFPKTLR